MSLVFIGTYGEKLGHVDGKGKGVYALRFDRQRLNFAPSQGFLGQAQLGSLCRNPTYLASHRDEGSGELHLYVVDEREDGAGTIVAARVDEATGELQPIGSPISANDLHDAATACCYVAVSPGGQHVLAANYLGGSVCAIARLSDGSLDANGVQYVHLPPASHPVNYPLSTADRQDKAHAHMALLSHGSECSTLLVPDLGSDVVWSLRYEPMAAAQPLGPPMPTAVHEATSGGGPRHVALHPSAPVAYVGYELSSLVGAFGVDPRTGGLVGPLLSLTNVLDGVPAPFLGVSTDAPTAVKDGTAHGALAAEYRARLRPDENEARRQLQPNARRHVCDWHETSIAALRVTDDGGHLVVSSRLVGAPGSLSAIALEPSGAFAVDVPVAITSTLGRTPRDFVLLPPTKDANQPIEQTLALVANQDSDDFAILCAGRPPAQLFSTPKVPTPVCLCFAPP